MNFADKYTTAALKLADEKEKDKVELSNDAYAISEMLEKVKIEMWRMARHGR